MESMRGASGKIALIHDRAEAKGVVVPLPSFDQLGKKWQIDKLIQQAQILLLFYFF